MIFALDSPCRIKSATAIYSIVGYRDSPMGPIGDVGPVSGDRAPLEGPHELGALDSSTSAWMASACEMNG